MSIVWDIWNAIHNIVTTSDWITLGIAVVVLLAAGFMMQGMESLMNTTLIALLAFALLGYVRMVTLGKQNAAAYATTDWHNFLGMPMIMLLAYVLTFAVGIAVVNLVLGLVRR